MAISYTVLVVDQAEVVRQVATRTLAESGCRVLQAANANGALAVLRKPDTHVDLVLIGTIGSVERDQLGWECPDPAQIGTPYAHLSGGDTAEGHDQQDFPEAPMASDYTTT